MHTPSQDQAATTRRDHHIWVLFILSLAWFGFRFYLTLNFGEFGDETEKFIAAAMMNDGSRLYGDIFANHGPLNYLLANAVYILAGAWTHAPYRVLQAALYLAFCGVVWACPLLATRWQKLLAVSLFLFLIGSFSVIWLGHMLLFHAMSGLLLGCFLLLVALPTWAGLDPGPERLATGGAALALLGFNAFSNGVVLLLSGVLWLFCLVVFGQRKQGWFWRSWGWLALGAAAAALAMLGYLSLWGDIKGYFVYHVYFNMEVYRRFITFSFFAPLIYLKKLVFLEARDTSYFIHGFILVLFVTSIAYWPVMLHHGRTGRGLPRVRAASYLFATVLFFLTLVFLNSRGKMDFHAAGYFVTVLISFCAAIAYGLTYLRQPLVKRIVSSVVAGIVVFSIGSTFFQRDLCGGNKCNYWNIAYRSRRIRAMPEAPTFRLIRRLTSPDEPIMALVFRPDVYLFSRRKPASGQFFYLPAQAVYDRNPLWNYKIDLKSDLERTRPKVIFNDWWRVWGRYDPHEYIPWLGDFLDRNYRRLGQTKLYIRRDVDTDSLLEPEAIKNSPPRTQE